LVSLPDCQLVGVLTAPRQFSISYRPTGVTNVLHADMSEFAAAHAIPCQFLSKGMNDPELFSAVCDWRPDCFIVVGWYHMVPAAWRKVAPAYGLHASLLPDYSGGAPLVWAMINGERRSGITFFQFSDGVDNGPVVGSLPTDILPEDTIATLYARIEDLGLQLLQDYVPLLARGAARLMQQDESKRRLCPQRSPEDGRIEWSQGAERIHDFIRAQTRPYPGAFALLGDAKISIWRSALRPREGPKLQPGELALIDGCLWVGCGQQTVLEIVEVGEHGSDRIAADWAHSKAISVGEAFHV
jgi:methionyl-tRNA formyltransferase